MPDIDWKAIDRATSEAEAKSTLVPFDPMDGCPQCTWVESNLGRHLEQMCSLHERIADLQFNYTLTRCVSEDMGETMSAVVGILGGDDDDDPIHLARACMEEIASMKAELESEDDGEPWF